MAAKLFYLPFRPALDANGLTISGATLTFYATGTTTPQTVFADSGLSVPLANPVTANAAGVWPAIYLDNTLTYRCVLKDADGATLNDSDPYLADVADAVTSSLTAVANAAAASASSASSSATAAAASATAAATSATNASTSAATAASYASSAINAPGTSADSTTSLLIGTGSKSLTITTGKAFSLGQFVILASKANTSNYMFGQITAFTSGTGALTVNVTSIGGSGTLADWTISLSAPGATGAITATSTDTFQNKTINLSNNTLSGTVAQFNAAISDGDLAAAGWTQIAQLATTSGTTQTFTSIPQTYADLLVVPACSHNSAGGESLRMDISDDNGTNWSSSFDTWSQVAADTIRGGIWIKGYRLGTGIMIGSCPALATNRTLNMRTSVSSGAFGLADWRADAGINALRFKNSGGAAFDAGTITLYGR